MKIASKIYDILAWPLIEKNYVREDTVLPRLVKGRDGYWCAVKPQFSIGDNRRMDGEALKKALEWCLEKNSRIRNQGKLSAIFEYHVRGGTAAQKLAFINEHGQLDGKSMPQIIFWQGEWQPSLRVDRYHGDVRCPDLDLWDKAVAWCEKKNQENLSAK